MTRWNFFLVIEFIFISGESGGVDNGFVGSIVEVDGLRVQVDLKQPCLVRRAMKSQLNASQ